MRKERGTERERERERERETERERERDPATVSSVHSNPQSYLQDILALSLDAWSVGLVDLIHWSKLRSTQWSLPDLAQPLFIFDKGKVGNGEMGDDF